MHDNGYAHRDIKPENCMVQRSNHTLKLVDFGRCTSRVDGSIVLLSVSLLHGLSTSKLRHKCRFTMKRVNTHAHRSDQALGVCQDLGSGHA